MNITIKLLAVITLLIATLLVSTTYASKETKADEGKSAKTEENAKPDKKVSLKDKLEARDRVMFLAKRKFTIEDGDYNIILNEMNDIITKEHELEEKSASDEEKARVLTPMIEQSIARQKQILKDNYEEYAKYIKANEYYKLSGWDNVEKAAGLKISLLGIIYVFSGLLILVVLLILFGRIFSQKTPSEDVITIEMDNSPVRESSKSSVKRSVSTILIRKDLMEKQKKEGIESKEGDIPVEVAIAIAMAIHAELHLYAKAEKITVLDYPNVVSSWAFTSRPVINSHFQKLRKR